MSARKPFLWGVLCIVALLIVPVSPAWADGIIVPKPPPDVSIIEVPFLTIQYHRVEVTIEDQVAITHVDQVFVNEGRHEVEGTYLFPLPEGAAISEFAMWVDGEKLEGQILERDEAHRIYEDIVRQRRDPALLEYVGHNAFQARIYPIPPGGQRRVELEYSQVLTVDNGLVEYVYPLNTEKFSPRPLEEVTVQVTIRSNEPLKAIYSPSHNVDVVRRGDLNATVGYEEYDVKPDRDYALYYTVSPDDVGLNLLSYKPERSDGFFLLLAAPKVEIDTTQVIAKDVLLILDVSGSMQGEKIEQAKEALNFVLDNLHDEDRFNIIAFSTSTQTYARTLVGAEERGDARRFVSRLDANGSTDINRALLEALSMVDAERPTILVFLTDGLPTVGETEIDRIIQNVGGVAPANARIFPFGVGYDVNTVLLDTIAQNHRGATGYVRPEESIGEKVSTFYAKVSSPLLADLTIDFGDIEVVDVYPYPLPDLFAGTQLMVVGRYRQGGQTDISLTGKASNLRLEYAFEDVRFEQEGGEEFIARLWATRKIGYLLQQIRLHGEDRELVDEVVELSIRYGIVTPYTSFLVEETDRALTQEGREALADEMQAQATALPAFGQQSVERSAGEKTLSEAEAPAALAPGLGSNAVTDAYGYEVSPVKYVGAKTFVLNDGVWTDTLFDPARMKPTPVGFGSEDYFALVAARPEWGRYLAVGAHVIVVLEKTAYEIRDGEAPAVDIPPATPGVDTPVTPQPKDPGDPGGKIEGPVQAVLEFFRQIVEAVVDFFSR